MRIDIILRRTIIALPDKDKAWLDQEAARTGVSMTEVIRRAVALYRQARQKKEPSFDELLERTKGTWKEGEGLEYQRRIRSEWDRSAS